MTAKPKRKTITKTMVDRALNIYTDSLDLARLAGPIEEHEKAMRKVLNDAFNGYHP